MLYSLSLRRISLLTLIFMLLLLSKAPALQVSASEEDTGTAADLSITLESHLDPSGQVSDIQGGYAYVRAGYALQIFDIDDPSQPVRTGSLLLSGWIYDVVVVADYAYILSEAGLHTVDVGIPSLLRQVDFQPIETPYNVHVLPELTTKDGYLYVEVPGADLDIFDLSDPARPEKVNQFAGGRLGLIEGDYLYYATPNDAEIRSRWTFHVADLSDPSNPTLLASIPLNMDGYWDGNIDDLARVGDYIYLVGHSWQGRYYGGYFEIIDVANPASPVAGGLHPIPGSGVASTVIIHGDYAYFGKWGGNLVVADITDPTSPQTVTEYETAAKLPQAVHLVGNHLYLSDTTTGIAILDVAAPREPETVGTVDDFVYVPRQIATGKNLYVAGGDAESLQAAGAQIIERSSGMAPEVVGKIDKYDNWSLKPYALAASGDHLYLVSFNDSGPYAETASVHLEIFDVSEPGNPQKLSEMKWEMELGRGLDIAVADSYVYLVLESGLRIIDASNPEAPQEVGTYEEQVLSVAVRGQYAYLGVFENTVTILDITNPAAPTVAGTHDIEGEVPGCIGEIVVEGNYAYLAAGGSGLVIVDVSVVADPQTVTIYPTQASRTCGAGRDMRSNYSPIAIEGNYAFLAVPILDISDPARPREVAHQPTAAADLVVEGNRIHVAAERGGLLSYRYFAVSDYVYLPQLRLERAE